MSGVLLLVLRILLAIALYAFLGVAVATLWIQVRQQSVLSAAMRLPILSLTLHRANGPEPAQYFTQPVITLGRDPACECRLKGNAISARHARLSYHASKWWLEDLRSAHGTRLNGELLTAPMVVASGDEINCGNTRLTITLDGETPASSKFMQHILPT